MFPETSVLSEELNSRYQTETADQLKSGVHSLQPPTQSNPDCTPAQPPITQKSDTERQCLSFIKY